jgi:hypothetical protein
MKLSEHFTLEELTTKFNGLSDEQKNKVFEEATANAALYHRVFPDLPLLLYILKGDEGVHPSYQGPIIQSYKEWKNNR